MRTRIALAVLGAALLLTAFVSSIQSDAEIEEACRKALDNTSTADNRPKVCDDVPGTTYRAFLLMYELRAQGLD
jgi:hypothetical protein